MSRIPIPTSQSHLHQQSQQQQYQQSPTPQRTTSGDIMSTNSPLSSDTRRKQSKRDETLRRKIESELSRKRPGPPASSLSQSNNQNSSFYGQNPHPNPAQRSRRQAQKGTVAGLKPSPALTVPENMTVSDASQLCAAKRTDCVLVVDQEEGLSGIFTAKDLAFRVTAEGLDPRTTLVSQIMTPNPMVTRDTTSATQALQLMVEKHFRHLPVCNEDGDVVGLLDITKVFHEALAKVERSSSASAQLTAALAGVQTELGGMSTNPQAAAMMAYAEALKDKMALPDLTTVMNTRIPPPMVSARTSVKEAARLMKERRTTAVCVMEGPVGGINNSSNSTVGSTVSGAGGSAGAPGTKIAGIFTSKDVVLRVIAAGLDPGRCSVVRVMTPHPDTALPTLSVQDALRKMHNGHYLNLPVVESDGRLVGIVDVLKLTYATLEQIESMSDDKTNTDGGPMWSKFFEDLGQAGGPDDDTASMISGSHIPDQPQTPNVPRHMQRAERVGTPFSELQPGDSASAVDDEGSEMGKQAQAASSVAAPAAPVDDGTYIFKFKTPSGRTHRFQARHDNYENLREIVFGKLSTDPFFPPVDELSLEVPKADPGKFNMSYTDDDGDRIWMTQDSDVTDAVKTARMQKSDRVVLTISGGKAWEEAAKDMETSSNPRALETLKESTKEEEEEDEPEVKALEDKTADPAKVPTFGQSEKVHVHPKDDVMGIPRDLVLPASLGFLGVVIIGVFMATRAKK